MMKELWEEIFDVIAHSIATLLSGYPVSEAQVECTRGWMRSHNIDKLLKKLSEDKG